MSHPTVKTGLSMRARNVLRYDLWTNDDDREALQGIWASFDDAVDSLSPARLRQRLIQRCGGVERVQFVLLNRKNCGKKTTREILEWCGLRYDPAIKSSRHRLFPGVKDYNRE